MNTLSRFNGVELWQLAGWTMLHFLWIGSLIGVAALALRQLARRAPANIRYVVALGCLCMLAGTPGGVAAWLVVHGFATSVREGAPLNSGSGRLPTERVTSDEFYLRGGDEAEAGIADAAPTDELAVNPSRTAVPAIPMNAMNRRMVQDLSAILEPCARYLPWLWLFGTPVTFVLLTTGVVGAERLRRASQIIDGGPIAEACARVAEAMRITRRVAVAVCERVAAPVLVGIVRPIILMPAGALTYWSVDEIEMVLLHELAHVRRWDNLVNLLQRMIESFLFFHPAVWLVSSWVRREREACCDAIVVGRTERPHAYAELLVALAAQMPRSVLFYPAASSAMAAGPLRVRIRRILQLEDDPMLVSGKSFVMLVGSVVVAATLAVLYLPAHGQAKESAPQGKQETTTKETEEKSASDSDIAAANLGVPTLDDQKFAEVPFVQGATRFSDGDSITVREVRGTAATFEPGNIYWIEGIYTLGSHDRAALSAFTTANDAANATGPIWKIQTTAVKRGSGTFTLYLPMSSRGWPHLSFYPADGGESFGGVYFGTGDSVLKQWWGANEAVDSTATHVAENTTTKRSDEDMRRVTIPIDDNQTATAESQPGRLRLQIRRTEGQSGKFPSLEEQKLADVAWKRLGLELEPIGEDDLKRVKALGYDGGVTATQISGTVVRWEGPNSIMPNDILVGLHVWPTTNLKDVAEVLNRDDLADVNPLKFYVVRLPNGGTQDIVVTGRISVNLDNQPTDASPRGRSSTRSLDADPFGSRDGKLKTEEMARVVGDFEQMKPGAAKDLLIRWIEEGRTIDVITLLGKMSENKKGKILSSFSTPADLDKLREIERLQSDSTSGKEPQSQTPWEQPRVVGPTLMPIPRGPSRPQREERPQIGRLVDESLASDPNMAILNQQLMQLQFQLMKRAEAMEGGQSKDVDRLKQQIAGEQKQIDEYQQQTGSPAPPFPPVLSATSQPAAELQSQIDQLQQQMSDYRNEKVRKVAEAKQQTGIDARPTPAEAPRVVAAVPAQFSQAATLPRLAEAPRVVAAAPIAPVAPSNSSNPFVAPRSAPAVDEFDGKLAHKQVLAAQDRMEAAAKWKAEALSQRQKAKDDAAVEVAKPELEAAMREYLEAKRAYEEANRHEGEVNLQLDRAKHQAEEAKRQSSSDFRATVPNQWEAPQNKPTSAATAWVPLSPPEPTQVMPAAREVRVGSKWLEDGIGADKKIAQLREQLMAAQTELQIRSADAGGAESEAGEKLQKQMAEFEQSVAEQVQKKQAELLTSQQAALDNAVRQTAAAMAKAQIELERAAKEHEELAGQGVTGSRATDAAKRLEGAKRAFQERQQAVEAIKRQFEELQRQRAATTVQQAQATQQAQRGPPRAEGAKREAEAESAEAEAKAKAKQEAEAMRRDAEEVKRAAESQRREAEAEARHGQDEARREAEEAKRDAEAAGRESEQQKRQAEQAEREQAEADRPEAADEPHKGTVIITKEQSDSEGSGDNGGRIEISADEVVVHEPQAAPSKDSSGERMRYDGKTFDEWRTAWKTELSAARRQEVVKALAAFGANGYGKEAAAAILDLVQQLDWSQMEDTSVGQLKWVCVSAFGAGRTAGGYRIPTVDWLPIVIQQLREDKKPTKALCLYVFPKLPPTDDQAIEPLLEMSRDRELQSLALMGLKSVDPRLEDERIVNRLREVLADVHTSAEIKAKAISLLLLFSPDSPQSPYVTRPNIRFVPEVEKLLFDRDPMVRRMARGAVVFIPPDDAPAVVQHLMDILNDKAREADHLDAIRALAAVGPAAIAADNKLHEIAKSSEGAKRDAAIFAVQRLRGETNGGEAAAAELLRGMGFSDQPQGPTSEVRQEFYKLKTKEQQEVFPTADAFGSGPGHWYAR